MLSVVGLMAAVVALGVIAARSVLRLDANWDALMYHLPFAALRGGMDIPYTLSERMASIFEGFPALPHLLQGLLWRASGSINATGVINILAFGAFLAYAQHDWKTCTTALECADNSIGKWLSRAYTVAPTAVAPAAGTETATVTETANVAASATVTASSQNTISGQTAAKAVDGVIAGHPVDATREWATVGGRAGSYLNLGFPAAVTLNRVVLYDRPNASDQVTGGTLTFSDGTLVPVPALDNAGQATSISWPEYVMYIPSAPCGRWVRSSHLRMPNWTIPIAALSAATLITTSTATRLRRPSRSR